jgi:hypothetical protein
MGSAGQENPLSQESEAGTAEHLAFEHLDPVDVSFDDSGVPGQGEPSDDGIAVTFDACGEGVEAGEIVTPDGVQPLRQPFALALGEHLGKGPDVSGEGVEFGAVDQDGLESKLVDLWEGLGASENPAGDDAG